jgi:hypothetical protein
VAAAVDGGREAGGEEVCGVAPRGLARARHRAPGAGDEGGEGAREGRVGGARLDLGEVGGGALVEGDEFVRLVSGEAASAAQQFVQPVPLRLVCGDEDIQVHEESLADGSVGAADCAGGSARGGPGGAEAR